MLHSPYPSQTYAAIPHVRGLATAQQDITTNSRTQQLQPVTHIRDHSLRAPHYNIKVKQSHGQDNKVPIRAACITTEYAMDSSNRAPRARVFLSIRKPKPLARIED